MSDPGFTVQSLMVWSDREQRFFGERPGVANGLLYLPAGQVLGDAGGAVLFVHRWGGYHYDELPRVLGPVLAERGVAFLSFGLRRRGLEGPFVATPDDDVDDIKLALDYLAGVGLRDVVLAGEEVGALSVCRYAAQRPDLRVAGVAMIRPAHDLHRSMEEWLGPDDYGAAVTDAVRAVRMGAGHDHLIDGVFPGQDGRPVLVSQNAGLWLSWWSPTADTKLSRAVERVVSPLLIVGADTEWAATLEESAASRQVKVVAADDNVRLAGEVADWVAGVLPALVGARLPLEIVTTETADGSTLAGFLWTPLDADPDTAVIYVHGMTSTALRAVPVIQAPVFAREGWATLSIEMRRSGLYGHSRGTTEMDVEDIDAFVELLVGRGYRQVITSGHSLGSIGITMHQVLRRNPAVVANVHLAPTAETSNWARRGMGAERYEAAVDRARAAVDAGLGDEVLIRDDYRTPDPDPHHRLGRHYQRARSWLSWWGPEAAATHLEHLRDVNVPVMLLAGTNDQYSDEARITELEAAVINAPDVYTKLYEGCNHSFDGFEQAAANDVVAWLSNRDSTTEALSP